MTKDSGNFWGYAGRFTVVHVVIYTLFAIAFLSTKNSMPASTQVVLEM